MQKQKDEFVTKYKQKRIGTYSTKEEAAIAYDNYLRENKIEGVFNFE